MKRRAPFLTTGRVTLAALLLLAAASWIFIVMDAANRPAEWLNAETWANAERFVGRLAGAETGRPAFLEPERWREALLLTYGTLQMSVMAAGLAGLGALLTVIPASRTAADGSLTLRHGRLNWVLYGTIRAAYVFSRAVPELIWAMLIVFIFRPGLLPGAVALAIHNFGILGKLCAEVVEDLDLRAARALRTAGAGTFQILLYAIFPAVLPKFLTYLLYRWEIIIRTTIVVGFVAAGGLGREFRLAMSWFHYTDVALLLICYIGLVWLVDLVSGGLRRLAR